MKMSIFLTSFFSMYASGSKFFTSPAMRVANWVVSNLVIGATPLWPALIPAQFASVPIPSDDTSPMPVTTTRRLLIIGVYFLVLACDSMYSTASFTRVIFSASSSGISMPNSSSNAITSSTVSSESAPRSSTNEASGVTSSSSTPSCSTMMLLTLSATAIHPSIRESLRNFALRVHPAIDRQDLPRNIRRLVRRKKADGRRDIVRCAEASQRYLRRPFLARALGNRARHIRFDQPWRHDVDGDAARRDFERNRLGESDDPRLRRGVVRLPRITALPDDRADTDDPAAALPNHRLQHRLSQREDAGQVGRDHRVPVLALHPQHQLVARDARVVDEDIDPPEPLE